jgi:hypothetical protein
LTAHKTKWQLNRKFPLTSFCAIWFVVLKRISIELL